MGRGLIPPALAIIAGAAILAWPLALNAYPIVFSDTGALLDMGLIPSMGWDKPFVYGPLAVALSLHRSLLLTAAAQTALLSYMLWTTQSAFAPPRPWSHIVLCGVLAAVTSAPWFATLLLPDAFTAIVALGLITTLGRLPRRHIIAVTIITALAIASHLSHLVLAAGVIAALTLARLALPWRPIVALSAALLYLLASNLIGHGRLAVSPYGSVFALARLIADGPARDYLARVCPEPTFALCAWRNQLTDDSDQFLWDPASPFWSDPLPLPEFAAQASRIVVGTIRAEPLRILRIAYRNAARELGHADLGDTLVADYLADTVRPRIALWFPPAELARYDASRQVAGTLAPWVEQLLPLQRTVILLSMAGCSLILVAGFRRPNRRADVAALVLIALFANAVATGALSAVHDRYQARLVWIILLPFLLRFTQATASLEPAPRNPAPASP